MQVEIKMSDGFMVKYVAIENNIKTQQYNFQQSGFSGYQSLDSQDSTVLCPIKGIYGLQQLLTFVNRSSVV